MANLMSCAGFEGIQKSGTLSAVAGECIKARLGLVFLFFIVALMRKWGGEEMGLSYSLLFGLIGSLIPYIITVTITASFKIAMVVGIIGAVIGGYGGGMIFGGEDY